MPNIIHKTCIVICETHTEFWLFFCLALHIAHKTLDIYFVENRFACCVLYYIIHYSFRLVGAFYIFKCAPPHHIYSIENKKNNDSGENLSFRLCNVKCDRVCVCAMPGLRWKWMRMQKSNLLFSSVSFLFNSYGMAQETQWSLLIIQILFHVFHKNVQNKTFFMFLFVFGWNVTKHLNRMTYF